LSTLIQLLVEINEVSYF